jgi:hypothetical protein
VVELPVRLRADLASVRAALERKGALAMAVLDSDPAFMRELMAHVWADPKARRLGIHVVREHWRGEEDGQLSVVEPYLRGSRTELPVYLASLPGSLRPRDGLALVLDPIEIDQLRTLLVDRRRGMTLSRVADAQVIASPPKNPELFEVKLTLAPDDAARLLAITFVNVGKKLALELRGG